MAMAILNHDSLSQSLGYQLTSKLEDHNLPSLSLRAIIAKAYRSRPAIIESAENDLQAILECDPACTGFLMPFLFFKGFLALQTYRVAHWLHLAGRETFARHLQARCSDIFDVDIHPAAIIGSGVFIDHGTGIVIGETAVVGDDVSMLQGVTLGASALKAGKRHPTIGAGVLLSADSTVLGPITVGNYAKVAAGPERCSSPVHRCRRPRSLGKLPDLRRAGPLHGPRRSRLRLILHLGQRRKLGVASGYFTGLGAG
jgi:serine O-acetyltransferase